MSPPIPTKQLTTDNLLPTQLERLHLEPIAFEEVNKPQLTNLPHTCIQQSNRCLSIKVISCGLRYLSPVAEFKITSFSNLTSLIITYSRLEILPEGFINLPLLKIVDVSHNILQKLPEDIGHAKSLETLLAHHNHLCHPLPESLLENSSLKTLTLHHNPLLSKHFPNPENCINKPLTLAKLTIDSHIALNRANIPPYPLQTESLHQSKGLMMIKPSKVSFAKDTLISDGKTSSTIPLETIISSVQELVDYPNYLMKKVSSIHIYNQPIEPALLIKIKRNASNLRSLILINCKIDKLADDFFKMLPNLVYLDLSDNNLTNIPSSLSTSTSIQECHLNRNLIQHFPIVPKNLCILTLNYNILCIDSSTINISHFANAEWLQVLELSYNCILARDLFPKGPFPITLHLEKLLIDIRAVKNSTGLKEPFTMKSGYTPEYTNTQDPLWLARIQQVPFFQKKTSNTLLKERCGLL